MFDSLKLIEIIDKKKVLNSEKECSIDQYLKDHILSYFDDPEFGKRLTDRAQKLGLPSLTGRFGQVNKISDFNQPYSILAVDGSQIWPDRHFFGSEIALIQIGGALFSYGQQKSSFDVLSRLELVGPENTDFSLPIDRLFVEQLRDLFELENAIDWARNSNPKPIIFMDGSLKFLIDRFSNQSKTVNPAFSVRFFSALDLAIKSGLSMVFYTSFPSSKAFTQIIKILLCRAPYFDQERCVGACGQDSCQRLSRCNDSILFNAILPDQSASQRFVVEKEGFLTTNFFINTGNAADRWAGEIARVELLGQAPEKELLPMVFDQICKGFGYPIGLCQAHEIAVLDENDRQTFKSLMDQKQNFSNQGISQKLESKKSSKT